jgi:hypothetical protein
MNEDEFMKLLLNNNTTISNLTKGSYGLVFVINYNGRKLLMKFSFINKEKIPLSINNSLQISSIKEKEFTREINTQKNIYNKSKSYPLCPEIFFHKIYNIEDSIIGLLCQNKLIEEIIAWYENILYTSLDYHDILIKGMNSINNNNDKLDYIVRMIQILKNMKIGICLMEYLENYDTLHRVMYKRRDERELFISYAQANIILLAMMGYNHLDFHASNILCKIDKNGSIRIMLIDFGFTQPLTKEQHSRYLEMICNKDYSTVLQMVYEEGEVPFNVNNNNSSIHRLRNHKNIYKYITGKYNAIEKTNIESDDYELNHRIHSILTSTGPKYLFDELKKIKCNATKRILYRRPNNTRQSIRHINESTTRRILSRRKQ